MRGTGDGTINLASLIDMIRRRWLLFVAIALPITAAVIVATTLVTPIYSTSAKIKIDPNPQSLVDFQAAAGQVIPDQSLFDTEVSLMASRDAARAIVRRFNLTRDIEFAPKQLFFPGSGEEQTIDAVLKQLEAARQTTTYVVDLTVRSIDPVKAARLANAFAEQYLAGSAQSRVSIATNQSDLLDQRLTKLGAEAREADGRLAQYRAKTGLMERGTTGTITESQIVSLTAQLGAAESAAAAARSSAAAARSQIAGDGLGAVSGVLASNVVADLRSKRADVLREQGDIGMRYGPLHPSYLRVTQQLADMDRQLADEGRRIVSGAESDARAANARVLSLRRDLAQLRNQQAANTRATAVAESLRRQAEAKSTVYTQTSEAAQRVSQQERGVEPRARIVQIAPIPIKPSFPNKPLFAVLGLVFGGICGFAAMVIAEQLATGVRSAADVERRLGLPVIASLPKLSRNQLASAGSALPLDYAVERPTSAFAAALRGLRQTLGGTGTATTVIAIGSALAGEGKTNVAVALARTMALSGDRVVLIDCHLAAPGLGGLLQSRAGGSPGLLEVLDGSADLAAALTPDRVEGLDLLPLSGPSATLADLFGRPAIRAVIAELTTRYDRIILDTPAILSSPDVVTVARLADQFVLVVAAGRTPRRTLDAAIAQLSRGGVRVAGVVLWGGRVPAAYGAAGRDGD